MKAHFFFALALLALGSLLASPAQVINELFAKPLGKGEVFVVGEALGGIAFTAQGQ